MSTPAPDTTATDPPRPPVRDIGLVAGVAIFAVMALVPPLGGMPQAAWIVAALTLWMAAWWMTEAVPLSVTALLPFLVVPLTGAMDADAVAGEYYDSIILLILGGAFLALAIERTGLHGRLALAILNRAGSGARGLLLAFMVSTALLSMFISNTSTTLIMVPIAAAVLHAGGIKEGETNGIAGALMMGIAFAASIGGIGTLVGSPTNAIAAGLINEMAGTNITFLSWAMVGLPVVALGIPLAMAILMRVQKIGSDGFDSSAARRAIGDPGPWSIAEKRLVPLLALVVAGWLMLPLIQTYVPKGALKDGTIAIAGAMLLFVIPDGKGTKLLEWREANRAPWGVILMFGGGLALAGAIGASGLAAWLGEALVPLRVVPVLLIALAVTAMVVIITEFASNVATASAIIPVVAALIAATGADPMLLAMPAAMAASWGFMLPSGTGPNAIAWASWHIALPRQLLAGLLLDVTGVPLMIAAAFAVALLFG